MTNWYIFRHSLATLNKTGYGDQILTASILPDYIGPIERMSEYLKSINNSTNFSSTLLRCLQTTQIITRKTGKKFQTDSNLNEYYKESFEDLQKRIHEFVAKILKLNPENILVCSHGAVIAGIKNLLTKDIFTEVDLMDYPQCGQLLIIKERNIEILDFNY